MLLTWTLMVRMEGDRRDLAAAEQGMRGLWDLEVWMNRLAAAHHMVVMWALGRAGWEEQACMTLMCTVDQAGRLGAWLGM